METAPPKKFLTPSQAMERMRKYCAYQERSQLEVRRKLIQVGQRGNDLENILAQLIEENFLNEERFALAYARGKFRMKGWGRNKIIQELKQKGISTYCINKAMKEIDAGDYRKTFVEALKKKALTIKGGTSFSKRQKLSSYLIRKGYEQEMVWEAVKEYFS
ncbi:MAG: regulatory protein RecX [Chitinophagales bacterium]